MYRYTTQSSKMTDFQNIGKFNINSNQLLCQVFSTAFISFFNIITYVQLMKIQNNLVILLQKFNDFSDMFSSYLQYAYNSILLK